MTAAMCNDGNDNNDIGQWTLKKKKNWRPVKLADRRANVVAMNQTSGIVIVSRLVRTQSNVLK
jgi:hypothetical protein